MIMMFTFKFLSIGLFVAFLEENSTYSLKRESLFAEKMGITLRYMLAYCDNTSSPKVR